MHRNILKCFVYILQNRDYDISIREYKDKLFSFDLPEELKHLQTNFKTTLDTTKPNSILELLQILTDLIKKDKSGTVPINYCQNYRQIMREFREMSNFYLDLKSWDVDAEFTKIKLLTVDIHSREHAFEVKLNMHCESDCTFEVVNFDLPLEKESFTISRSLREIYEQFREHLGRLQPFFDIMDTLDRECWVLDPVPPQRSCKYRRICIGKILIDMRKLVIHTGCVQS